MAFFLRRAVVPTRSVVPRRYMSHDDPKELEKGARALVLASARYV